MQLTEEQLLALRKPFQDIGAFEGYSEDEIKKLLEDIAEIYRTLININVRTKQQ
jgi:cell division septum initiation protein DivIVA